MKGRTRLVLIAAVGVIVAVALIFRPPERDPAAEAIQFHAEALRLQRDGRLAEADSLFVLASNRNPSYALPRFHRARLLESERRWSQAESGYRLALTSDPSFLPGYEHLARLLLERGRLREAYDFATEGIQRAAEDDSLRALLFQIRERCLVEGVDSKPNGP